MDMKRFFLYAIVIAALALAGCSSGGGTSLKVGDDRATQALIDALQSDHDEQKNRADAAEGKADMYKTALGAIGTILDVEGNREAITAAIMGLKEDSDDLTAVRTALSAQLTANGVANPAMATQDQLVAAINSLKPDLGPAPTAKSNAITGAIVSPATAGDPTTARGIHYAGRPGNDGGDEIFVRQGNSVTDTAASIFAGTRPTNLAAADAFDGLDELNKDDMVDDPESTDADDMISMKNQFMPVSDTRTSQMKSFVSEIHKRMMTDETSGDVTTDEINLFTNKEEPGSMTWAMYYATENRSGVSGDATTKAEADMDGATVKNGQITIVSDNTDDNFNGDLLVSSRFPSEKSQIFTFADAAGETPARNGGQTNIPGQFNGVQGQFSCDGTCTVTTDAKRKISALAGTWIFVPTSAATRIPDVDHDSDFLAFGWWLRTVEDDGGDTKYTIGTFAEGAQVRTLANIQTTLNTTDFGGTANYSGPAGGKYARKWTTTTGEVAGLKVGHFTASATLKANFGGDDVAVNEQFSITGSVDDFMDENDEALVGWTVKLNKAGFAASGVNAQSAPTGVPADANTFYGTTTGNGDWQGMFYGPIDGPDGPDNGEDRDPIAPTGVAGEFSAHFSNGHVIGAFGATQDK